MYDRKHARSSEKKARSWTRQSEVSSNKRDEYHDKRCIDINELFRNP